MSAPAAAIASSAYWRAAGMSYLKYANMCAEVTRSCLKEPFRQQSKAREAIYFRSADWAGGKAGKPVITEINTITAVK